MGLEEYVKENYPNVMEEYNCFVRDFVPSVGSEVASLIDDLGGISGQSLEVIGYSALGCGMDAFIDLKNRSDGENCMCSFVNWHKKVKLMKGEFVLIKSVNFND
ncbi:hypothetical protein [Cytobacillus horneckiae]|uniref:hypothetical protein n=1 Tax=Cytobacillus horneckiae TaxID=549687 RepID=UPI00203CD5E2|nr:hypothetical protein [Cytobacillus horneckiae]MCM3180447.1 hypothetical protein [Cytobacillus horneckiae]